MTDPYERVQGSEGVSVMVCTPCSSYPEPGDLLAALGVTGSTLHLPVISDKLDCVGTSKLVIARIGIHTTLCYTTFLACKTISQRCVA